MGFAPVGWWGTFPGAEGSDEGVGVFVAEEVGGFVELEEGVVEVVAG